MDINYKPSKDDIEKAFEEELEAVLKTYNVGSFIIAGVIDERGFCFRRNKHIGDFVACCNMVEELKGVEMRQFVKETLEEHEAAKKGGNDAKG